MFLTCPHCKQESVVAVLLDIYTGDFETTPIEADTEIVMLTPQYTYVGAFCASCEEHVSVIPKNL